MSSFKQLKIKIVSIVLYRNAQKRLKSKFKFIDDFIFEVEGTSFSKQKYKSFFKKYTKKCKNHVYGFQNQGNPNKGILSNIVFYNNCPNNTPAVLWCKQGKDKPNPIFHYKKVNLKYITAYLKEKQKFQKIFNLMDESSSEYTNIESFIKNEGYSLFIDSLMFLVKRKEMGLNKYLHYSNTNNDRLMKIIECCKNYDLIATKRKNGKLTSNGQIIVNKFQKLYIGFYGKEKPETSCLETKGTLLYYPIQVKGIKI